MPAVTLALDPAYRRVTVAEFLDMDFGEAKAELEDGLIYIMAGGSEAHTRVATNILTFLRVQLRGTGCRPYRSDFAAQTDDASIRYPDVSVYCGDPGQPDNGRRKLLGDPVVVVEVLSPSTRSLDEKVKLPEYKAMPGVRAVVLVDAADERTRLSERTDDGWHDHDWRSAGDVPLAALHLVLPRAEIFARD